MKKCVECKEMMEPSDFKGKSNICRYCAAEVILITCSSCKEVKSSIQFAKRDSSKTGFRGQCKACISEVRKRNPEIKRRNREYSKARDSKYSKEYFLKHKERILKNKKDKKAAIKTKAIEYMGGSCQVCGYSKCIAALEFHHVDPSTKNKKITRNSNWISNLEELDKCILLCSNCHRELHYEG